MPETTDVLLEIFNPLAPPRRADSLLYTPAASDLVARESRIYRIRCTGDREALAAFLHRVLSDPVCDRVTLDGPPAIDDFRFYLEIGLKPGLLDLERETILRFFHELEAPAFDLADLRLFRRVYLSGADPVPAERFVKDLVNPVIHQWQVTHG